MQLISFVVTTVTSLLSLSIVECLWTYDVYYKWKSIEYNIPPNVQLNSSEYIRQNNIIAQIKIYENRMWLITPRFWRGVPFTLNTVPYNNKYHWWEPYLMLHDESPKLLPFPNYEMNRIGDCNALQLASALEIDQFGRLWVLDVGRINVMEPAEALNLCPAKLVIFDVKDGRSDLIFSYTFPHSVAPNATSILKEIQLICETEDDCWAFIADIFMHRLVVYDHRNRQAWTGQHPSMAPDPYSSVFLVGGEAYVAKFGINGLALAPQKHNFSDLYFSVLASKRFYRIKTQSLINPRLKQNGTLRMDDVIDLGEKQGQSVGFAMSSKGELFYGNLPGNSVISTQTSPKLLEIDEQHTAAQSEIDLLWPNAFGFDDKGKLAVISDKFHLTQRTDPNVYNYRVLLLRRTGHVYPYNFC